MQDAKQYITRYIEQDANAPKYIKDNKNLILDILFKDEFIHDKHLKFLDKLPINPEASDYDKNIEQIAFITELKSYIGMALSLDTDIPEGQVDKKFVDFIYALDLVREVNKYYKNPETNKINENKLLEECRQEILLNSKDEDFLKGQMNSILLNKELGDEVKRNLTNLILNKIVNIKLQSASPETLESYAKCIAITGLIGTLVPIDKYFREPIGEFNGVLNLIKNYLLDSNNLRIVDEITANQNLNDDSKYEVLCRASELISNASIEEMGKSFYELHLVTVSLLSGNLINNIKMNVAGNLTYDDGMQKLIHNNARRFINRIDNFCENRAMELRNKRDNPKEMEKDINEINDPQTLKDYIKHVVGRNGNKTMVEKCDNRLTEIETQNIAKQNIAINSNSSANHYASSSINTSNLTNETSDRSFITAQPLDLNTQSSIDRSEDKAKGEGKNAPSR